MQLRPRVAVATLVATAAVLTILASWQSSEPEVPPLPNSPELPPTPEPEQDSVPVVTQAPVERESAEQANDEGGRPTTPEDVPVPTTFKEQLKAVILSMRNHGGVPKERLYRTLDSVDDVAKNPAFNPNGKVLTVEQRIELAALVKELNDAFDDAGDVYGEASFQATLRAFQMDQVVRIEAGRTAAENFRKVNEAKELLSQRFGKELKDWRCTQSFRTASGDSSAKSWIALTYYTVHQSPAAFEAAEAVMRVGAEKGPRYRRFFANLR